MTAPTPEILCPDCGHSIVWNGQSWHDEGKSKNVGCTERGCKCKLSQQQALEKFVEQDRAAPQRAALLEVASIERRICIGVLRELICRAGMPDGAELLGKFMAGVNGIGDLGEELRSIAQEQERAQEVAK